MSTLDTRVVTTSGDLTNPTPYLAMHTDYSVSHVGTKGKFWMRTESPSSLDSQLENGMG